jgi:hypothetical protein
VRKHGENDSLQLFALKAACDKPLMTVSQSINNLFLHIPRTGGSSIWHSLVAAHDPLACLVVDIYHTALTDHGSPERIREALEGVAAASKTAACRLYHHHAPQDVREWLPPAKTLNIATVLRDPVDRLVSNLAHLRAHIGASDLLRNEILASWSPAFQAAMLDAGTSMDDLATLAVQEPAFRNYYVSYLSAFLLGHPACPESPHPPLTSGLINRLADTGRRTFCAVGRYEHLAEAYSQIAAAFNIGGTIQHHINRTQRRAEISASARQALRHEYSADYELIERLTASGEGFDMPATVLRPKQFDPSSSPIVSAAEPTFQFVAPSIAHGNLEATIKDGAFSVTVENGWMGGAEPVAVTIRLDPENAVAFARWVLASAAKAAA